LHTVAPASKFMLAVFGRTAPVGNTVRKPAVAGPATVRLTTTAATPAVGTPALFNTGRSSVIPAPTGPAPPFATRVSRMRVGVTGW
jgi:hypothetical protein